MELSELPTKLIDKLQGLRAEHVLHFNFLLLYGQVLHATGTSRTIPLYSTTSTSGNKKCGFLMCFGLSSEDVSKSGRSNICRNLSKQCTFGDPPFETLKSYLTNLEYLHQLIAPQHALLLCILLRIERKFGSQQGLTNISCEQNLLMHLETRL